MVDAAGWQSLRVPVCANVATLRIHGYTTYCQDLVQNQRCPVVGYQRVERHGSHRADQGELLMASALPSLTFRLLGTADIQVAGQPLMLPDQKARGLLFYLAATEHPHTRDHLASLFWSESPDSNARHSLRSSLYHLRQAFHASGAEAALVVEGDLVALQLDEDACDVVRFRRLSASGDEQALVEAISLYRGSFLQGFTLADAPFFQEWMRAEQDALCRACLDTLNHLVSLAEDRQAWEQAITYARRMVQLDPLAEDAQQKLISFYLRAGAIGPALRQYRQFEVELRQELGLTPSLGTQALIQHALRIRRNEASSANKPVTSPGAFSQSLPLIGRDDLLTKLLVLSRQAQAGRGVAVLVQGEDGMGKSRLLDELADRLSREASSWLILRGSCSPFDDLLPFGPFLEAFESAGLGDLTDLLTTSRDAAPESQGGFFWRLLQALRMLTRDTPLLLAIDDLHWAKSSTLHLFGLLATRLRILPMMLVGTVRQSSAVPALQRLVFSRGRHGDVHLLSLPPLTLEAVTALLQASGVSAASMAALADWLHGRSGGSPFILLELLAQLRAEAILRPFDGGWQLDTARWLRWRASAALPETIHDVFSWGLADLAPEARHLLEVLAVAEQPLPFVLLSEFFPLRSDQLLSLLEGLIARRLVVETAEETFALPHHLLREALVYHLSYLRRRMLHRKLAEALEACPVLQRNPPLRQIALHAVAGEDVDRARRYGLRILPALKQEFAGMETVNFLQHLHDLLAPTASSSEMLDLTFALGQLHQALGHLAVAARWQQQYLAYAQRAGDIVAQATAHFEMSELALISNDYRAALASAQAGLQVCAALEEPQPLVLVARGQRLLGAALAMEGSDLLAAEHHLQEAVAAHRLAERQDDLCATLFELGNVAAQRGELVRALEWYEEASRTAAAARVHHFLALAQNNIAYHSLLLGKLGEAQKALASGLRLAETSELLGALLYLLSTQGEIALYQGEWTAATEVFQRGLLLAEELGSVERQAGCRGGLALTARGQGNLDEATTLLEEALALINERGYWHLQVRILLWLAETLLLRGRLADLEPYLERALLLSRSQGRMLLLIQSERVYARLLAAHHDWPAADAIFAGVMQRSADLGLPLERARTQAAWGEAMLRAERSADLGRALIAEASEIFMAHHARAELQALRYDRV